MYKLNYIYNEDCRSAVKNIPSQSVDCIYIDIPYLYQKGGNSSLALGTRIINLFQDIKDISNGIDYSIFSEFKRIMKKINIFIWCSPMQLKDIIDIWCVDNVKLEIFCWCKTNAVPKNNGLLTNIEYCLWFREKGIKVNGDYFNKSKFFVSSSNKEDKKLFNHPTIKPLEFVKNHIICATNTDDLVCDFYSGSGTTAVACKELGRNYLAFEIRKDYYDDSLLRINGIQKERKFQQMTLFEVMKNG